MPHRHHRSPPTTGGMAVACPYPHPAGVPCPSPHSPTRNSIHGHPYPASASVPPAKWLIGSRTHLRSSSSVNAANAVSGSTATSTSDDTMASCPDPLIGRPPVRHGPKRLQLLVPVRLDLIQPGPHGRDRFPPE